MPNTLPNGDMVHDEIEAQNIAERYLMGKLSLEESGRFEEHFVDCPRCQDRLEATERFRAAMKSLPPEAAPLVPARPALPVRQAWPRTAWLMAAGFLVAVGVSTILAVRMARMGGELEQTKIASLDWRHRYETEQASAALRRPAADQPVVASTFYLNTTRGEPDAANPANRITVPADSHWVVLALDREIEPGFQSLRANLKDSAGQEVWQQSGLPAGAHEPLSFVLPSDLLHSSDYVLTIEGLSSDGRYQPSGRYRFRATGRP